MTRAETPAQMLVRDWCDAEWQGRRSLVGWPVKLLHFSTRRVVEDLSTKGSA